MDKLMVGFSRNRFYVKQLVRKKYFILPKLNIS